ncbi:uncharacterized protein ppp1r3ab isoform X1 [Paramisgurnus dabryanus]|uniref:uncharacterized protein ppp1r3ab isoform X1 n=2 Tax=Paramisgurnus dabryanus TaxID=90735 RepID=UPI003CCF3F8B
MESVGTLGGPVGPCTNFLSLPAPCPWDEDDESLGLDGIRPKTSPTPRRRSSVSSDDFQPPPSSSRRVSFADAFGLSLVSVKQFDARTVNVQPDTLESDTNEAKQYYMVPLFTLPQTGEELDLRVQEQKIELQYLELLPGTTTLRGVVRVLNLSFDKMVNVRTTLNSWRSHFDLLAEYVSGSNNGEMDCFSFKLTLVPPFGEEGARVEFCLRYETSFGTFWANNNGKNYAVCCYEKTKEKAQNESENRRKSCLKGTSSNFSALSAATTNNEEFPDKILNSGQDTVSESQNFNSEEHQKESKELLVEMSRNRSRRNRRKAARLAKVKEHFARREEEKQGTKMTNSKVTAETSMQDYELLVKEPCSLSQQTTAGLPTCNQISPSTDECLNHAERSEDSSVTDLEQHVQDAVIQCETNPSKAQGNSSLEDDLGYQTFSIDPPVAGRQNTNLSPGKDVEKAWKDFEQDAKQRIRSSKMDEDTKSSEEKPVHKENVSLKTSHFMPQLFSHSYAFGTIVAPLYHQVFKNMETKRNDLIQRAFHVDRTFKELEDGSLRALTPPENDQAPMRQNTRTEPEPCVSKNTVKQTGSKHVQDTVSSHDYQNDYISGITEYSRDVEFMEMSNQEDPANNQSKIKRETLKISNVTENNLPLNISNQLTEESQITGKIAFGVPKNYLNASQTQEQITSDKSIANISNVPLVQTEDLNNLPQFPEDLKMIQTSSINLDSSNDILPPDCSELRLNNENRIFSTKTDTEPESAQINMSNALESGQVIESKEQMIGVFSSKALQFETPTFTYGTNNFYKERDNTTMTNKIENTQKWEVVKKDEKELCRISKDLVEEEIENRMMPMKDRKVEEQEQEKQKGAEKEQKQKERAINYIVDELKYIDDEDEIDMDIKKIKKQQDQQSDSVNQHLDSVNKQSDLLNQHSDLVNQHSDLTNKQTDLLNKHSDLVNQQSDLVNKQDSYSVNQHSDLVNQQSDSVNQHSDSVNQQSDLLNQQSDSLNTHSDLVNQQSDSVNQHSDSVNQQSDSLNKHSDLVNKHSDLVNQQSDSVNQHSDSVNQQSDLLNKQSDSLNKHSDLVNQQSDLLNTQSDSVNQHSVSVNQHSNLVNQHSDSLNQHSDSMNQHSDLMNQQSEVLNKHSDLVNQQSDLLNKQDSDSVNQHSDSVYQHSDLVNQQSDLVNQHLDSVNQQSDLENQQSDLVNQHSDSVNQQLDLLNKQSDSVNQHSDSVNQHSDLVTQQSDLLNQQSDLVNQHSDLLNQQSDLVNQHSDLVTQQSNLLNHNSDLVNQQLDLLNQQSDSVNEHSDLVNQLSDLMNKQSDLLSQQSELFNKHSDLVKQPSDLMNKQDSDSVNQHSDLVNQQSDLVNKQSDLLNNQSDSVNQHSDLVNKQSDLVNQHLDSVNQQSDLENQQSDLVNQHSDSVNQQLDLVNKQTDLLNQQSDSLNKHLVLVNQQSDLLNNQSDSVNQHSDLVNTHSDSVKQQTDLLSQQSDSVNQHSELVNQQSDSVNQHSDSVNQHSDLVNQLSDLMNKQSDLLSQQSELFNKHSDLVKQPSDLMNKQDSDSVNQHSDLVNQQSDLVNKQSDLLNQQSDSLNKHLDLVNLQSDLLNKQSDSVNQHSDSVNQHSDLVTQQSDLLNQQSDLVNQHSDLLNQQSDLVNQHSDLVTQQSNLLNHNSDLVNQQLDLLNQQSDSVNEHSDSVNQYSDSVNQQSDLVTQHSDLVTQQSDLLNHNSDLVNQQLDLLNQQSDSVNEYSDSVNQQSDSVHQQSDLVNKQSDLVNHQSDSVNKQSDLVNHQSDSKHKQSDSVNQQSNSVNQQSNSVNQQSDLTNQQSDLMNQPLDLVNRQSDSKHQQSDSVNLQLDLMNQPSDLVIQQSDSKYQQSDSMNQQFDSLPQNYVELDDTEEQQSTGKNLSGDEKKRDSSSGVNKTVEQTVSYLNESTQNIESIQQNRIEWDNLEFIDDENVCYDSEKLQTNDENMQENTECQSKDSINRNTEKDFEDVDDNTSTESLVDDEMELYLNCLRNSQQSVFREGSVNGSFCKRPSVSRRRSMSLAMPSISESVDEDQQNSYLENLSNTEDITELERATLLLLEGNEPVIGCNVLWWKEFLSSDNMSRVIGYSFLLILFFVAAHYYDFIACFALYLLTVYWLFRQGEEESLKSSRKGERQFQ